MVLHFGGISFEDQFRRTLPPKGLRNRPRRLSQEPALKGMPEWQGRCDRCGAFIRVDRKHLVSKFDERHGRLCSGCGVIEGVA